MFIPANCFLEQQQRLERLYGEEWQVIHLQMVMIDNKLREAFQHGYSGTLTIPCGENFPHPKVVQQLELAGYQVQTKQNRDPIRSMFSGPQFGADGNELPQYTCTITPR